MPNENPTPAAGQAALDALNDGKALTVQGVASLPPEAQANLLKPAESVQFNGDGKAYIVITNNLASK